ncbi:SHOCT domain-containing protein [Halobaculum lipolyticum]|uniref:SHOCT domain-containing protein n=1 Tax=Halobaculum lipolyticum TaxID=3032001 RepID=A0ABD5WDK0_9EURY|nr:SHOCT domain-containing protein [Halobaculum sp. DT31]
MPPSTAPYEVPESIARFTPDSRRWRRRVAAACAIGAPLAVYATVAVVSGVSSGFAYNVLILLCAAAAVVLPAVATAVALAPASAHARSDDGADRSSSGASDPVETLKRRYATGDLTEAEFDERLDRLVELDAAAGDRGTAGHDSSPSGEREREGEPSTAR